MQDAAEWYDDTPIVSEEDRIRIGRTNAIALWDLDLE
jgi:hypothetical protein